MTRYFTPNWIGYSRFEDADKWARGLVAEQKFGGAYKQAIVYEQTGHNPPEVLAIWSANP